MTQCRNCGTAMERTFCPNCGQKDVDLERPMGELIGELLRETFDIDGRAFRAIRALLLQPGFLTREYLAGRRRSYTSPIRLYLAISVTFFLLVAWLASRGILLDAELNQEQDAASQAQFMSNELPRLMFVLLGYFLVYLVISLRRVYHATPTGAALKSVAILLAYMAILSIVIETMSSLQILSD